MAVDRWSTWRTFADFELFRLGGTAITASSLVKLVVATALLLWLSARLRRWLVTRGLRRLHVDDGTRESIASIVRYAALGIGFALILQNAGINLAALGIVAGALGVGIGFGLQNVVSNFISGLIVMLERPIRVGDRIEVGGIEGVVRDIGARRTAVLTTDQVTILVPNQRFITDNVVNHAYAGAPVRLRVPLTVPQGTDFATLESVVLAAARTQAHVLAEPPPALLLTSLGGATAGFELAVWHQPQAVSRQELTNELNRALAAALAAHGLKTA